MRSTNVPDDMLTLLLSSYRPFEAARFAQLFVWTQSDVFCVFYDVFEVRSCRLISVSIPIIRWHENLKVHFKDSH